MDGTAPWMEADGSAPPSRRRGLLVAAAALPWVLLGVTVLGPWQPGGGGRGDVVTAHPAADATAPGPTPDGPDAPDVGAVAPPHLSDPAPTARTTDVTDGDVAAVATAVVRAWLSEDGAPELTVDGVKPRSGHYLEHATVRRIEVVGPDHAVVTVAVLVLDRDGDGWAGPLRATDVLVPVTVTATDAHPAGAPWWGPRSVALAPRPLDATPEDDPALAAEVERVLGDAGYREVSVRHLAAADDGLLEVDVHATGPDGVELDGPLWVVRTPSGIHVLGDASGTGTTAR